MTEVEKGQDNSIAGPVAVSLLGAAGFIVTADSRVVNPLLHVIATEFNTDIGSTGYIVTAYTIPYGLFQLVYGPLGDRIGKLQVMVWAMALFAVGTAACAFAPTLLFLDLLRLLTGIVAAALIPLSLAYIGDNFPYNQRQTAIAQFIGWVAMGNILSTSLGGIVADFLTWRLIFLVYGLVSLVVFFMLWRVTQKVPRQQNRLGSRYNFITSLKPFYQLILQPGPRLLIIAVFLEGFFFYGAFAYLGAFLKDRYNLLYLVIGLMLSGFGLGSLIYSRSVRWLLRRVGENGLILIGGWFCCLTFLAIVFIQSWILFIPLNILMGLGFYMIHSTLQTKATEMAPGRRGTAVSLFAFGLFLGQGAGAAVLGYIVDQPGLGYDLVFSIGGVAMALLGHGIIFQTRRYSRKANLTRQEIETSAEEAIASDP